MQREVVHGYDIAGNYRVAIAISLDNPLDYRTFVDECGPRGAFEAARTWADPSDVVHRVWGVDFIDLRTVSEDSRCKVTFDKLHYRIVECGWPVERAAVTPYEN